ncbi:MAG: QacE family quaternary ammonium compound efflux SMR transporter [Neisseriaceae bacterium]|nr:QacE family quaternary ammonium compound efflux SMR transporter [Neisseriaceae bacterium]MBP6861775.1 QacE family quaternary ammonium compound efflux SMR transporter [Neisseriaceae bacterium]
MTPVLVYLALGVAIVAEVIGTSLLPHTQAFTRPVPTLLMALMYGLAFYLLAHVIRTVPVGIAYAIWSGLGIVLIAAVNYVVLKQTLDLPAMLGLGLIIAGVLVINLFSKSVGH